MANWQRVGEFLQKNMGNLASVAGGILVGGPVGGIAAVSNILMDATGTSTPESTLKSWG